MNDYDKVREQYRPKHIRVLLIAESQPPAAEVESSRQFYRSDRARRGDRLFINTLRTLYPETLDISEAHLEQAKEQWLRKFQTDGWYMIEALESSLSHEVNKQERQELISKALPRLLERVRELAALDTKIILIKSNVFEVAAEPLRQAGFRVLNTGLLDYPGRFNQRTYREKLAKLAGKLT